MSSVLVKQQHQISGVQNELIYQGWERFMNPRTPTLIMKPYEMKIGYFLDPAAEGGLLVDSENSYIPTIFNTDLNAQAQRKRKTKKGEREEKFNGIVVGIWTGFGFPAITIRKLKEPKRVYCPLLEREKTVWFEIGDGSHRTEYTWLYIHSKEKLIIPKASARQSIWKPVTVLPHPVTGNLIDITDEQFIDISKDLQDIFLNTNWILNIYDAEWASNSENWSHTCHRANCTTGLGEYELLRMALLRNGPKHKTAFDFISNFSFSSLDKKKNDEIHPLFKVAKTSDRHDANEEGVLINEKDEEASFFAFALKSYRWISTMSENLPIKNFPQDSFEKIEAYAHQTLDGPPGTIKSVVKSNWDLLERFCEEAQRQNVTFRINFTLLKAVLFLLYRWKLLFNGAQITDMILFVKACEKAFGKNGRLDTSDVGFWDSTIKHNVVPGSSKDSYHKIGGDAGGYGYRNLLSKTDYKTGYYEYGLFLVETVGFQLDYTEKEDYGLSDIGIKISDPKRTLTEGEKNEVLGHQIEDDIIYCYVDKKPVARDEGVFAHVVAHADGGKTTVDNIRFVRKCYNSESGTQNLDEFKKKVLTNQTNVSKGKL